MPCPGRIEIALADGVLQQIAVSIEDINVAQAGSDRLSSAGVGLRISDVDVVLDE